MGKISMTEEQFKKLEEVKNKAEVVLMVFGRRTWGERKDGEIEAYCKLADAVEKVKNDGIRFERE